MKPTWHKPVGVLAMLAALALYAVAVVSMLEPLQRLPVGIQLLAYAIAGTVWIVPLGRFLRWMETGRWR